LAEKAERGVGTGQEHRDDRKAGFLALTLKREIFLTLLPGAHLAGADAHGHRTTVREYTLQRLRPGLAGREIPAIEKDREALFVEPAR
jgi:hypothetical protein